jgi:transcription antitermination protein NusB
VTASATQPSRRSGARLAAVQALYQLEFNRGVAGAVVEEFLLHRFQTPGGDDGMIVAPADRGLFDDVVRGVALRRDEIDGILRPMLPERWALDRLEPVLRACLRAGVYELIAKPDVPARVVIDEYVGVVAGFSGGGEPGLLNGILDRIARDVRATEFASDNVGRQPAG